MTPTSKQNFDLEQEKMLPGVVMAVEGQVFDMLYQLADLDEPRSGNGIEFICKEIHYIVHCFKLVFDISRYICSCTLII